MEQLTQQLRSGRVWTQELPWPQVGPGRLLVHNHFSLISAGTESSTVKAARKSLLGKAKERPQQVQQMIEVLRRQGPVQAYRAVVKKLDAYAPLGYSSAGEVIEIGAGVEGFATGDKVACAGAGYASHAEIVCVPQSLSVKLPPTADLKLASYNTLGAIALQGIRQADLRLGESCAVIGLGLLGQLACLMLRASGVKTLGIDIDSFAVDVARDHCCDAAWVRTTTGIPSKISNLTGGLGVDAVVVTAGTASLDPINFAGAIVRRKGRVVVIGAVPTGFDRDPYWYKKELELRMSCSYGPGRYDPSYEEKGIDYPPAYVRWTQKRNMEAFQELVHTGRLDLAYLTTHEFSLQQAPQAYDMIVHRSVPFLGVILKYDAHKTVERRRVLTGPARPEAKIGLAFVGAGSYAQSNLLPHLPRQDGKVARVGVMTSSGTTSKRVSERFGFRFCTSEPKDLFENDRVNTIFVATRHDSHAWYVIQALRAGKHVFVEKPLCLMLEELAEIEDLYRATVGRHLMIGYNRRFSPYAIELKKHLGQGPISILYRVNAGSIPADHWMQDKDMGGGRILGEACHFIDFCTYLCGSLPRSVHAAALCDPRGLNDTVSVNLEFADGSIAAVCYFANGSKKLPKEYIEAYNTGLTGIIRDFKELEIHSTGKSRRKRSFVQDKGQARMVQEFLARIGEGGLPLIPAAEIFAVTRATFAVQESLRTRQAVSL
ncbi:MAG: bi-domain-containing oxidoreductase [Planctomycetes bacterium]|nr:bi-domain-containing oxidoreductase [Planctomycetota bacterium]